MSATFIDGFYIIKEAPLSQWRFQAVDKRFLFSVGRYRLCRQPRSIFHL